MIYERIKKILSEQFEIENVDLNTVIREDLNLDSIGILEFVMAMEEEFGQTIEDDKLDEIVTIKDAVDYIEGRSKE